MEIRSAEEKETQFGSASLDREPSRIKQSLGQLGRRIKSIDVRDAIASHPFTAIGISAAIGAVVGLVRPMPQRSRVTGAVMGVLTAIAVRTLREAAARQLGMIAKEIFGVRDEAVARTPEPNIPSSL